MDDFYINETDEDLYSESHAESNRHSRQLSHKVRGKDKKRQNNKQSSKKGRQLTIHLSERPVPFLNEILINDSNDLHQQQELPRMLGQKRRLFSKQPESPAPAMFRTMYRPKGTSKDDSLFYQTQTEHSKQQQQMWQTSTFVFQNYKSPSNKFCMDTRNSLDRQKSVLQRNDRGNQESAKVIRQHQKS